MNTYPKSLKYTFSSIIKQMARFLDKFVKSLSKDFTRNRNLDFETLFKLILGINGNTFDDLTQEKITLLMNHMNSVSRKKLNDKKSLDLAEIQFKKELVDALSLKRIAIDDVCLNEDLGNPAAVKKILLEIIRAWKITKKR